MTDQSSTQSQPLAFTKPSEILIAAKAVIADPKHWTVGALARDAIGNRCQISARQAVCFCSVGAYYKVVNVQDETEVEKRAFTLLHEAAINYGQLGCISIADLNDYNDHDFVMSVWDRAIELAIAAEQEYRQPITE